MALLVDVELPGVYLDAVVPEVFGARLHLFNREPEPFETGVLLNANVALSIIDTVAVAPGINAASLVIYVNGVLAYDGPGSGFQPGFDGPESALTPASNTLRVYLHRTSEFASLETVSVRVLVWSNDAAEALDETYTFTARDFTAPKLVAAQAVGHRVVRVTFDEDVRALDPAATNDALNPVNYAFSALSAPAVVPAVVGVQREAGLSYLLTLDVEATPRAIYRLVVAGVEDVLGNAILPPFNIGVLTGYECAQPQGRRFDLYAMFARKNRAEDANGTGDLRRFTACLQEVTELLLCDIDAFGDVLDPDFASEPFVDAMLAGLGNPFAFAAELPLTDKRRLLAVLVPLYKQKGTEPGIQNAIRFFLGFEVRVAPYAGDGLTLGESELGEDWVLALSNRRGRYSFDVIVDRVLTNQERVRLRIIVEYMKRVGTHLVNIIEPVPPVTLDHLELGASELGETFLLH